MTSNKNKIQNNREAMGSLDSAPLRSGQGGKILIIHDRFQFKGGAERLVLILANALNADLMTEFWELESFDKEEFKGKNLYVLDKGETSQIVWRYFRAHFNFLFKTRKIVRQYNTVIFSGNNCLTASFNCKKGTRKILYCHSPVRHVFDLKQKCKFEQTNLLNRFVYYYIGSWGIRFIYWLGLRQMDFIIANAKNIKKRLWNFSHQKTDKVVYPPIEVDEFKWIEQGDYYLSFGRLERLKRIPDIIKAFQQMPNKKLVVVSGGSDLEKVKEMAKDYSNIKVVGWVTDEELADYVGKCIATIYIPIDEDFGMTPVESMSAGKPCIGVAEGGILETIVEEKTGKFIPADYVTDDLIKAVEWMTLEQAFSMKEDCIEHSKKFSTERFVREMKEIVFSEK